MTGTSKVLPLYVTRSDASSKHSATALEERALGGITREEELADLECTHVEPAASHQERDGACTAAQSRRLEVHEQRPSAAAIWRNEIGIEQAQAVRILDFAVPYPKRAMVAIGFVAPVDHEGSAEGVGDDPSAQDVRHAVDIDRRLVAADIRLIRQVAGRLSRGPTIERRRDVKSIDLPRGVAPRPYTRPAGPHSPRRTRGSCASLIRNSIGDSRSPLGLPYTRPCGAARPAPDAWLIRVAHSQFHWRQPLAPRTPLHASLRGPTPRAGRVAHSRCSFAIPLGDSRVAAPTPYTRREEPTEYRRRHGLGMWTGVPFRTDA